MTPRELVDAFTAAVEQRNGAALAQLFTEDGIYHDVFYGEFEGRTRVAALIDDWFYRHARDIRWDMHEPVSDGRTLYTRYVFSYVSTLPEANGQRILFEGVAIMRLDGGKIAQYGEVANTAPALFALGFAPERVGKIMAKQDAALRHGGQARRHLG
jgi:ketosteroid isomerase-like protein